MLDDSPRHCIVAAQHAEYDAQVGGENMHFQAKICSEVISGWTLWVTLHARPSSQLTSVQVAYVTQLQNPSVRSLQSESHTVFPCHSAFDIFLP